MDAGGRAMQEQLPRMPGVIHPLGVKFIVISLMKDIVDDRWVKK